MTNTLIPSLKRLQRLSQEALRVARELEHLDTPDQIGRCSFTSLDEAVEFIKLAMAQAEGQELELIFVAHDRAGRNTDGQGVQRRQEGAGAHRPQGDDRRARLLASSTNGNSS